MKVALNPEELRLIVDALDDKHKFQLLLMLLFLGRGKVAYLKSLKRTFKLKQHITVGLSSPKRKPYQQTDTRSDKHPYPFAYV